VPDPPGDWPRTTAIDQPTRLLLALVRAGEELEAATSALGALSPADTQGLIQLLQQQRVAPWVGYQLERAGLWDRVPGSLRQELGGAMARSRQRAVRQRLALLHTLRCLRGQGIAAVALKGAQLAWQHYPHPWLRPMRDLDLLLQEEEIGRAFALLEAEGFKVQGTTVRRPDDPLMWRVNDFSLWHPSGEFIELHRALWFRPGDILCGDFSLDPGFWQPDKPYRLAPDRDGIIYLQPIYLTLHCLVHHVLRQDINMGPLGLVDLELLRAAGHLHDPALAAAAARLGCAPLLATAQEILAGWQHTRWLTESSVPSWVLPLLMGSEAKLLLYLDNRSVRSHARQWLRIQARGGRWSGPAPTRGRRLANLARGLALLPRMASKAGVVEQLRRRLGKADQANTRPPLPPALVAATHHLQARSRGQG